MDGSIVNAFELDIDLQVWHASHSAPRAGSSTVNKINNVFLNPSQVVALRGSVPSEVLADFRRVLSRYARFRHSQRPQIGDIFRELGQPW